MSSISPEYRARLARTDPAYLARLDDADRLRETFALDFGAKPLKWSGLNVSRLVRATGERPERVAMVRVFLAYLGMEGSKTHPGRGGVFDHGELWSRDGKPWAIVGHPYGIDDDERALLAGLARNAHTLAVRIDDRPTHYGFRTNHVRIELTQARRPYWQPPATRKTRVVARAARRAFAEATTEAFGDPDR